jgi:hypothetical protein
MLLGLPPLCFAKRPVLIIHPVVVLSVPPLQPLAFWTELLRGSLPWCKVSEPEGVAGVFSCARRIWNI